MPGGAGDKGQREGNKVPASFPGGRRHGRGSLLLAQPPLGPITAFTPRRWGGRREERANSDVNGFGKRWWWMPVAPRWGKHRRLGTSRLCGCSPRQLKLEPASALGKQGGTWPWGWVMSRVVTRGRGKRSWQGAAQWEFSCRSCGGAAEFVSPRAFSASPRCTRCCADPARAGSGRD